MDGRVERVAKAGGATSAATCFFELDTTVPLSRRVIAESLGTFLLMSVVCGSSIASSRLFAASPEWTSVFTGVAVSGALLAMIFTFGTVSGGHFNPLITILQWLAGERSARCMLWYVAAQISGALCGAWLTRLLFVVEPLPS